MEPTSLRTAEPTERKGRKGSLTNPEVYENVPGHVIPILEREFDDFDTRARDFASGGIPEDEFIGFRLKQGVYGQRQPDVQMIRVKLPFGGVNPEQMEAFAATDEDRAITLIHDLGFIPRIRDGVRGVEVRTGGGTSIMARVGGTMYDFVEVDNGDYLKVSEAVLRIFDRQEDLRANRMRARIKFLIDRVGIPAFREMVDEEMKGDWVAERDFTPDPLLFIDDEGSSAPPSPVNPGSPNGDLAEFERFASSNARPQRQSGFSTVEVKVPRGDLTPRQFRGIAQI